MGLDACQDGIVVVPALALGTFGVTIQVTFPVAMPGARSRIRVLATIEQDRAGPRCEAAHVAVSNITLNGFQVTFSIEDIFRIRPIPRPINRIHWCACPNIGVQPNPQVVVICQPPQIAAAAPPRGASAASKTRRTGPAQTRRPTRV
jgi:hypothetical protein